MSTETPKVTSRPAARCGPCSGCVVSRDGNREQALGAGDPIYIGDMVSAGVAGTMRLTFKDGMRLSMAGGTLNVDAFVYGRNVDGEEDDIAALTIKDATFAIRSGRVAAIPDAVNVQAGAMSLGLQDAFVAGVTGQESYEMATLLPGRQGALGSVLVHNKVGVATLERPYHTVRLMGENGLLDKPMSLPSKVVAEAYGRALPPDWMAAPAAEDKLLEDGMAYSDLDDRLLERRFVGQQVFPVDNGPDTPRKNGLLEDAFDGERFRLNDDDPAL